MHDFAISLPLGKFRGVRSIDAFGAGGFAAPRLRANARYPHRGLDLRADNGDCIHAPFDGTIRRIGKAYADPASSLGSLHVVGGSYRMKLLYVKAVAGLKVGDAVKRGQQIANAQDVSAYHSRPGKTMQNHVHVELYVDNELVDPTFYLPLPAEPAT